MRDWNRAHLKLVSGHPNFSRKTRQRLPTELNPEAITSQGRPHLQILAGGLKSPRRSLNFHERQVEVVLRWNPDPQVFQMVILKNGKILEERFGSRSQASALALGFERSVGSDLRIPWSKVKAGMIWEQQIVMREFFFRNLEEKESIRELLTLNRSRLQKESGLKSVQCDRL